MRNDIRNCSNCKWFASDVYVCVNDKSEHCADFVMENDTCICWEGMKNMITFKELYECLNDDTTVCVYDVHNDELLYFGCTNLDLNLNPQYNNLTVMNMHIENMEGLKTMWIGLDGGTDET